MFTAIVLQVFALIAIPENDPMPWDTLEIVYKSPGKSVKGATPWRTESLNHDGSYPEIMAKGF